MIFSLLVRNCKIYSGWNYIPLSSGDLFTALIGENGVGKSAVLEALNVYFNNALGDWNYNHVVLRSGFDDTRPEICPFFIIDKKEFNKRSNLAKYIEYISGVCWDLDVSELNASHRDLAKLFISQRDLFGNLKETHYLFPIGIRRNSKLSSDISNTLGFLESYRNVKVEIGSLTGQSYDDALIEISSFVRESIDYIYIPTEIDYERFTKIEGKTIQSLMGSTIEEEVRNMVGNDVIRKINGNLDRFLTSVEGHLDKYRYQKPAQRQVLFNSSHLTSKIIEVYFESKVLNLKGEKGLIPVSNFSSGEKRKALIDIAEAFILKARNPENKKKVIFALDEPEVSLHLSACFDQFSKLENIARNGVQVLVTTHWYGFFPAVSDGLAVYIGMADGLRESHMIRLARYREDIKYIMEKTKGRNSLAVELKSINDTVQSVISSVLSSNSKWIVCEGYSDRLYLSHYFPSCGVMSMGKGVNVKRFYEYISLALADHRTDVLGRIFFLLDTDKQFEMGSYSEGIKSIRIRRFQNNKTKNITELLKASDNHMFPPTEIEDVLDARIFSRTLKSVLSDLGRDLNVEFKISVDQSSGIPAGLAFDLRESEKDRLNSFFDEEGIKVRFARKYCELDDKSSIPSWVGIINQFLSEGR